MSNYETPKLTEAQRLRREILRHEIEAAWIEAQAKGEPAYYNVPRELGWLRSTPEFCDAVTYRGVQLRWPTSTTPHCLSTEAFLNRLDNKIRRLFEEVEELRDFVLEHRMRVDHQTIEELQERLSHIQGPK